MNSSEYDVIVIGSGGCGLTAALAAADQGAKVLILEAFRAWGGSTGFCGGMLWIPNNHHMAEAGHDDSRDKVLTYLQTCMPDRGDKARWEAFVDTAPEMLKFLERETPLRFSTVHFPDSFAEKPGGSVFRHVEPGPLRMGHIGSWYNKIIDQQGINDSAPLPLTYSEITKMLKKGYRAVLQKSLVIPFRLATRRKTQQQALLAGLLKGCLDKGAELVLNARVTDLVQEGDRVVGVKARHNGRAVELKARQGVIMATGGFSWNEEYKKEFLPGPMEHSMTPTTNQGDAIALSRQVGAGLARMDEAWYWAAIHKPGLEWEGAPLGLIAIYSRTLPHSIMVNRAGRRFVNESSHNAANSFYEKDPDTGELNNLPCWCVMDKQWRDSSSEFAAGISPGKPDPDFLLRADTLEELAAKAGIDQAGLKATVERFNRMVREEGKDLDFQRGETQYDQFYTRTRLYGKWEEDASTTGNLGTIERPPFYALEMKTSSVGTKGGTMTDELWRALREDGSVIPGLYAAGNCSASIIGPITVAAAVTLGAGMTAAYIAGRHAARS